MNTVPLRSIGRLKPVALCEVWKHWAHDFTAWLADNLDVLSDVLGFDLSFVAREHQISYGSISLSLDPVLI